MTALKAQNITKRLHAPVMGRFLNWLERREVFNKIAFFLVLLAVISGFATYAAISETPPFGNDPSTVFILFNIDIVLLLLLAIFVARRVVGLWLEHKRGAAGARLHARLALLFALLAALPSIVMVIFASFFFHYGVQSWFSERISIAVQESQAVANAYLKEHQQVLRADVLAMANDMNRSAQRLVSNQKLLNEFFKTQSSIRNLSEALLLDSQGNVMARAGLTFSLELGDNPITPDMLEKARAGDVVLKTGDGDDRVRAFVQLDNFFDTYLLVGRLIEPGVLAHMARTEQAVREYTEFESKKSQIQFTITLMFVIVALLLIAAAVWAGLSFAQNLVKPITNLITAAERVRAGDLDTTVPVDEKNDDEFTQLAQSFNRMTSQLATQRKDLIAINRQLDERRRFTETVLSGVSAGVMGLDQEGTITVINSSAENLLDQKDVDLVGKSLADIVPQMESYRRVVRRRNGGSVEAEIVFDANEDNDTPQRTFVVRVAADGGGEQDIRGYVITFDDISPLLSAQRKAAWADVARRIAHEIKNPLTPIQLAAERLQRKYLKQIDDDKETFTTCTDTIIRQVSDIRQMVNEFSNFARMPAAVLKKGDLVKIGRETITLQKHGYPHVSFEITQTDDPVAVMCDRQQVGQAITNLLKNAVESIDGRIEQQKENKATEIEPGKIIVSFYTDNDHPVFEVCDNGLGLPKENRHNLTEPYVTTRTKGTGLGLAIVKKIMEDHGGEIILQDNEKESGACVRLVFAQPDNISVSQKSQEHDDSATV